MIKNISKEKKKKKTNLWMKGKIFHVKVGQTSSFAESVMKFSN